MSGGPGLEPRDYERLSSQRLKVEQFLQDGCWRTLRQIKAHVGAVSEAGVSARIRDLRKRQFGGHTVERRRVFSQNYYEYRMVGK